MKFGKNLEKLVDVSDPEWGPYWINYKNLKKRVNDIVTEKTKGEAENGAIVKSTAEVEFFRMLRSELKKTSEFFAATEQVYLLRNKRVQEAFAMLQQSRNVADKGWTRLLNACVKFYKDVLLLENFAIMNYCGFSKILKKHDKLTGFVTRDAFMRNVMSQQNFTHATTVIELLRNSEKLFTELQQMENVLPLQDEERLFIEAIRDLNHRTSALHESMSSEGQMSDGSDDEGDGGAATDPEHPAIKLDHALVHVMSIQASSTSKQLSPASAVSWVQATAPRAGEDGTLKRSHDSRDDTAQEESKRLKE